MRSFHITSLTALLCSSVIFAPAQSQRKTNIYQVPSTLSEKRVPMNPLPPPPPEAHGHPPDNKPGMSPCSNARLAAYYNCGISNRGKQPSGADGTGRYNNNPRGNGEGRGTRPQPSYPVVVPVYWPVGVLFDPVPIATWTPSQSQRAVKKLSDNGPQFSAAIDMSHFRVTGLEKGGWPVVVDYDAEPGAYVQITVVTQDAPPATAVLAAPAQTTRRLQLLRLPDVFGSSLKAATFSIDARASATDPTPRYLRIYGFGCGRRAVGSVAIDNLRFGPEAVTASDPETHFGFHTHTMFDKMKAEFIQVAFVDNTMQGQEFDNKKIDRRVAEGESINEQWNAKKAKSGPIQFRVRGWMTVRSDNTGGDWVSAYSPDLVVKQ